LIYKDSRLLNFISDNLGASLHLLMKAYYQYQILFTNSVLIHKGDSSS